MSVSRRPRKSTAQATPAPAPAPVVEPTPPAPVEETQDEIVIDLQENPAEAVEELMKRSLVLMNEQRKLHKDLTLAFRALKRKQAKGGRRKRKSGDAPRKTGGFGNVYFSQAVADLLGLPATVQKDGKEVRNVVPRETITKGICAYIEEHGLKLTAEEKKTVAGNFKTDEKLGRVLTQPLPINKKRPEKGVGFTYANMQTALKDHCESAPKDAVVSA